MYSFKMPPVYVLKKQFFVVERLVFLTPLTDVTLNAIGKKAIFECSVSKKGMKCEWFKGDKVIKRSEKYDISAAEGKHSLTIEAALPEDVSEYTIKFAEDLQSTAKLIIQGNYFVI